MVLLTTRSRKTSPQASKISILFSPLIFASICMFITITAHWCIVSYRLFQAVEAREGPMIFYVDWKQATMVAYMSVFTASIIIGDAVIIYRLWVVWNYNKIVVIIPLLSLIGLTVTGVGLVCQFPKMKIGEGIYESKAGIWINSDCIFTFCINVYSSVLIAYRIWKINRSSRKIGGTSLNAVVAIVIEAAMLYTVWTLIFFVTYQMHQSVFFFIVNGWPAISGITCMMINVRAGMGWAQEAAGSMSTGITAKTTSKQSGALVGSTGEIDNMYVMHPVVVDDWKKGDT